MIKRGFFALLLVFIFLGSVSAADSRLLVELGFDESSGSENFVDTSNYLTEVSCKKNNCPESGLAGRSGNSASFDGVNDYIQVKGGDGSEIDVGQKEFSIAGWFKTSSGGVILSAGTQTDHYEVAVVNGKLSFEYNNGDSLNKMSSVGRVNDGVWHHFVAKRTGIKFGQLYVDGVLEGVDDVDGPGRYVSVDITSDLFIGRDARKGSFFEGFLDNIQVYDSQLSESEIAAYVEEEVLNSPEEPVEGCVDCDLTTNLIAHWDFNDDAQTGRTKIFLDKIGSHNAQCSRSRCPLIGEPGLKGKAIKLDGSNDYLTVASLRDVYPQDLSLSVWINAGSDKFTTIFDKTRRFEEDGFTLYVKDGVPTFSYDAHRSRGKGICRLVADVKIGIGMNHIAVSKVGGKSTIYVNGVSAGSMECGETIFYRRTTPRIGGQVHRSSRNARYHNGLIDELRLFDRGISANDVAELYSEINGGFCSDEADCSDGLFCNGVEQCLAGRCAAPLLAAPLLAPSCVIDMCDEEIDEYVPLLNHDVCQGRYCNPSDPEADSLGCSESVDLSSGLLGHWKLDDSEVAGRTKTLVDSSGNVNDALCRGRGCPVMGLEGAIDTSFKFDGSNDRLWINGLKKMRHEDITVSAWVNLEKEGFNMVFDKANRFGENGFSLFVEDGRPGFIYDSHKKRGQGVCRLDAGDLVGLGEWAHIAVSKEKEESKIYVNGVMSAGVVCEREIVYGNGAPRVGAQLHRTQRGQRYLGGDVDDVRLYDRALPAEEIGALFDLGGALAMVCGNGVIDEGEECDDDNLVSGDSCTSECTLERKDPPISSLGLVGYWPFDTGMWDVSGNENHGICEDISCPTRKEGKLGDAFEFDGVNDYVQVGLKGGGYKEGSLVMWINANNFDPSPEAYMFGWTSLPDFINRLQFYYDDDSGELDFGLGLRHQRELDLQNLEKEKWYHLVATWSESGYNVYVNNVLRRNGVHEGLTRLPGFADIGNSGNPEERERSFDGLIDEVILFSRQISASEIEVLYGSGGGSTGRVCGNGVVDEGEECDSETRICAIGQFEGIETCSDSCDLWHACVVTEGQDDDQDGVPNSVDLCPETPSLSPREHVNIYGCLKPIYTKFDIRPDFDVVDIGKIDNFVIGVSTKGKIDFGEDPISLRPVSDKHFTISNTYVKRVDLDSNIDVKEGRIEINSEELPMLDRSATITLENVDVFSPKILRDGAVCADCKVISWDARSKKLKFKVSGFSSYAVVEDDSKVEKIDPIEPQIPIPTFEPVDPSDPVSTTTGGTGDTTGSVGSEEGGSILFGGEGPEEEEFSSTFLMIGIALVIIIGLVLGWVFIRRARVKHDIKSDVAPDNDAPEN